MRPNPSTMNTWQTSRLQRTFCNIHCMPCCIHGIPFRETFQQLFSQCISQRTTYYQMAKQSYQEVQQFLHELDADMQAVESFEVSNLEKRDAIIMEQSLSKQRDFITQSRMEFLSKCNTFRNNLRKQSKLLESLYVYSWFRLRYP